MMEIQKGDIVLSKNGRDKGKPFYVLNVEESYLLLVDGKGRELEQPKRKKAKHCGFLEREHSRFAEKMRNDEKILNSELRRAIAAYKAGKNLECDKQEGG